MKTILQFSISIRFIILVSFFFSFYNMLGQEYRILQLGNSITQADRYHQSFRHPLWESLDGDSWDFDFVGSLSVNYEETVSDPYVGPARDPNFDLDHEGHWGWYADALLRDLPDWLKSYTPDIVLLHAGTNDVLQMDGGTGYIDQTIHDLESLITVLRQANPTVTIFLAQLIPCNPSTSVPNPDPNGGIDDLNVDIATLQTNMDEPDSPVILIDMNSSFPALGMQSDGVHPNDVGESFMATEWYDALVQAEIDGDINPRRTWAGGTSDAWALSANWEGGNVPSSATDQVRIPASATNWPKYSGNLTIGTTCGNILMEGSSQLTVTGDLIVQNGSRLICESTTTIYIEGDWNNQGHYFPGNSNMVLNGSASSDINANANFTGAKATTSAGNYRNYDSYVALDCVNSFLLKSVKVYTDQTGTNTFFWATYFDIPGTDDTTIQEKIDVDLVPGWNTVELNFTIKAGASHQLGCYIASMPSGARLWRDNDVTQADFPYYIGEVAYITKSKSGTNYYYYMYDIEYTSLVNDVTIDKTDNLVTATGDFIMNGNLTIKPDAWLTNGTGNELSIRGDFVHEATSTGMSSFINNGTLTVNGITQVEQYVTSDKWHYVASPITDAKSGVYTGAYLKWFDEGNYAWNYITPITYSLDVMTGYAAWNYTDPYTATFEGSLNNGNLDIDLTYDYAGPSNIGYNFVGNPYPSALDWDASPGWTKTNVDNTIYFYQGNGSGGTGNYRYYQGSGGLPGVGTSTSSSIIPSMQGFFVKASAAGNLAVTNAARTHSSQAFYKKSNNAITPQLRLLAKDQNSVEDELVVRFFEEASEDHDGQYDAYKLFGYMVPQLYSITTSDQQLAINTLPEFELDRTIALGFVAPENGSYSISLSEFVNFESNVNVYLEDLLSGEVQNLSDEPTYQFVAAIDDDPNRFMLSFSELSDIDETTDSQIFVYAFDNNVVVKLPAGATSAEVTLYNMMGQEIFNDRITGSVNTIPINVKSGNYVLTVQSGEVLKTQKVYIK